MAAPYDQEVYEEPRISINKLGEYLTVSKPSRRERILKDAKYPPTFQVIRYEPTRRLIQRFLSGKIPNTAALAVEIEEYASSPANTEFDVRMKKSNIEAMNSFALMAPDANFAGAKLTLGEHASARRMINGVAVSVRPDLHLVSGGGNAPVRRGAIKLNISQGAILSKEAADYVGTLLRHHVEDGCDPGECDYQMCFALDVFGQKVSPSPKAIVNRMKDIEAGCGEIARQWANI